jgi:2-polyprenyl-3-methyl-5-hydroxy-6-metoxy-1,4-benzoquinol methylase
VDRTVKRSTDRTAMQEFTRRPITCPTCNVDDTYVVGRRGGDAHRERKGSADRIVRCRRCALLYPNPFPFPASIDELYSLSPDYFANHADQATKTTSREALVAALEPLVAGRRLLDVGAGLGETVAAALRRGWDAYGIEAAEAFASKAADIAPGRITHGTLESAPASLMQQPFDAVVLAAVLEHLHEPTRVLDAVARVLKPGGILYVDVPNESGIYFALGNLWNRLQRRDWVVNLAPTFSPYHVFGFNRRSLTAMLRKSGLEPEKWHFFTGVSNLPLRRNLRGVVEWIGSRAVHAVAHFGEQGTYLECFARKR